ncbi:hypothetical protein AN396_08845 [Candidatus Epulonipiscium fishelsonii]|uniref:Uncharacterized protein n=1 Tax=Candidatus Epulonipiscium fishelsonii TaxID=77094 RepID=A0ACC8XAM1_9FIRM|nr:hypothetical protein AN396_08845 [Epulopiscium sp. SCG-B11WGA-EpuloA1]
MGEMKEIIIIKVNASGKITNMNEYAKKNLALSEGIVHLDNVLANNNFENIKALIQNLNNSRRISLRLIFAGINNKNITTICTIDQNINTEEIEISAIKLQTLNILDPLTQLPNSDYFNTYFERNSNSKKALIYLDIDNFKFVNDSFGKKAGDNTLKEIVNRLKSLDYPSYLLGRIMADEFIIILENIKHSNDILEILQLINTKFDETFTINGVTFGLTYSAGIAMYPQDGNNFEEVCSHADIANHKSKEDGKRKYTFYQSDIKYDALEKVYMQNDIREAIQNKEFCLFYQPQVDLKKCQTRGFEALIRWIKSDGRIIAPLKFIPRAEETRLIIPMGTWVLREACCFINRLKRRGYKDVYVAVNVSGVQLAEDNFIEVVKEIVEETKINAKNLHLEITETILMTNMKETTNKIRALQDMGISIALDDFGTGYSSLTYLKQFPINILKIEKNFVDDIGTNKKNLVSSIINIGHELNLKVIAEGVENKIQVNYLESFNCDILQGYLVSKPLPEAEALAFLKNKRPFRI